MCPGVPVTAWATIRPRRSNTALARSPASRTIGENAARCSARACSLTVAMRLCHSTSSSIASNVRCVPSSCRHRAIRLGDPSFGDERSVGGTVATQPGTDDGGGLALLDDRRTDDPLADAEVGCAGTRACRRARRRGRSGPGGVLSGVAVPVADRRRAARPGRRVGERRQPPRDRLDADVGDREAVDAPVVGLEQLDDVRRTSPATRRPRRPRS